jgi:Ribbon-helix-helix protein, copG family
VFVLESETASIPHAAGTLLPLPPGYNPHGFGCRPAGEWPGAQVREDRALPLRFRRCIYQHGSTDFPIRPLFTSLLMVTMVIWAMLPYIRFHDMFFHMKTTLNIDDKVMEQLKREAAKQRRTMSELVESALRLLFQNTKNQKTLSPLPSFKGGGYLVDITDREALYQAMEGR